MYFLENVSLNRINLKLQEMTRKDKLQGDDRVCSIAELLFVIKCHLQSRANIIHTTSSNPLHAQFVHNKINEENEGYAFTHI